jgi:hypothetical protein
VRALAQQGHGRREERAEGGHPYDQDGDEQALRPQRGGQQTDGNGGDQRDCDRDDGATAIRLSTCQRGERTLDRRRRQERGCDEQGTGPEVGQPQRREHVQDAERHSGQHGQPQARADPPVAHRGQRRPQPLGLRLMRGPYEEGHPHKHRSGYCGHGEHEPGPHLVGRGPDYRAEQRPSYGGAERYPEQFSPPVLGHRRGQPGQASRPGTRPAQALDEAGRIEDPGDGGHAEDERRDAHQDQSDQYHLPAAQPGGEQSARERPDQGARGVARHQDARSRLG